MSLSEKSRAQLWAIYKPLVGFPEPISWKYATKVNLISAIEVAQQLALIPAPRVFRYTEAENRNMFADVLGQLKTAVHKKTHYEFIPMVRIYNTKIDADEIKVEAFVDSPKISIKITEYRKNQSPEEVKKFLNRKLEDYIETLDYYKVRVINLEDIGNVSANMGPSGLYRTTGIPNYNYTLVKILPNGDISDVKYLEVHGSNPPKYSSISLEDTTYLGDNGQCALDTLLKDLQGLPNFNNLTRASIVDTMHHLNETATELETKSKRRPFDMNNVQIINIQDFMTHAKISCYLVDGQNKLIWNSSPTNTNTNGIHALYYKVANDHIYPIDDEELKSEIRYNGGFKPNSINWTNAVIETIVGEVSEIYTQLRDLATPRPSEQIREEEVELKQSEKVFIITGLFESLKDREFPHNHLNALADIIYTRENLLVENLNLSQQGNILGFSYKLVWVVFNPDYHKVCQMLHRVKDMPEIKNPKKFNYSGQSLQGVLKLVVEEFRGGLPDSNLSTQAFNLFLSEKRGAYVETVRQLDECEKKNAFTLDISKCHTSILYNRTHAFGVFKPWDEVLKFSDDKITEGSYYYVFKPSLKLGSIKIGSGLYDSQFIAQLLDAKLIELANITHELRPSHTLPANYFKQIIDLVYTKCDDIKLIKEMFNKFIGSLGKMVKTSVSGELSTSEAFANHWKYSGDGTTACEKPTKVITGMYNTPDANHLRNLYKIICENMMTTHITIYQGILNASWWELFQMEKDTIQLFPAQLEPVRFHSDSITFAPVRTEIVKIVRGVSSSKFEYAKKPVQEPETDRFSDKMEDNGIFSESDDDEEAEDVEEVEVAPIEPEAELDYADYEDIGDEPELDYDDYDNGEIDFDCEDIGDEPEDIGDEPFELDCDYDTFEKVEQNEIEAEVEAEAEPEVEAEIAKRFTVMAIGTDAPKGSIKELINNMNQKRSLNAWGIGYIRLDTLDDPKYAFELPKKERETGKYLPPSTELKWDEVDSRTVVERINSGESMAIFGKAGRGKTYTTSKEVIPALKQSSTKYAIVSLSHKAVDNLRLNGVPEAMVIAKLFLTSQGQSMKSRLREIREDYSYIIVDEYTMTGLAEMVNFYTLYKMGMKFVFVGDYHQLPAIEQYQMLDYRRCRFFQEMCGNQFVELKTMYRFDSDLDEVLRAIYEEGTLTGITQKITADIKNHICYTNKTREALNLSFSKEYESSSNCLKIRNEFFVIAGSPIICKVNALGDGFYNNSLYKVVEWSETVAIIMNSQGVLIPIELKKLSGSFKGKHNFELGHAFTIHTAQGSTIGGRIAIHEVGLMTREMLYTAVSRATNLNNICVRKSEQHISDIEHEKFTLVGKWKPKELPTYKKALKGMIYAILNKKTNKPIYIGSAVDGKKLPLILLQAKEGILKEYSESVEVKRLHKLYYDFEEDLKASEIATIKEYQAKGYKLLNPKLSIPRSLKEGKFKPKAETKLRGFISVLKHCVRFRYSVNGVAKSKEFAIGKKRNLEQATAEAEEFQRKQYA
jgi:AAA domain